MILDLQEDVPSLHMIVVMETITDTVRSAVKSVGLKVVQYEDVLVRAFFQYTELINWGKKTIYG